MITRFNIYEEKENIKDSAKIAYFLEDFLSGCDEITRVYYDPNLIQIIIDGINRNVIKHIEKMTEFLGLDDWYIHLIEMSDNIYNCYSFTLSDIDYKAVLKKIDLHNQTKKYNL